MGANEKGRDVIPNDKDIQLAMFLQELDSMLCDECRSYARRLLELRYGANPAPSQAENETLRRQQEVERQIEDKDAL
jgi:hypothetical protein